MTTGTLRGISLKERVSLLPPAARRRYLESLPLHVLQEILLDEWWWTSRPDQVPQPGPWMIWLVLAGRGWGKSRSGAEWIVERTLKYPVDSSGAPTERLIIAETIADARSICIGGPSGVLRVLNRKGVKYRYLKSPKPQIIFEESECIIHVEGADDADVGRGHNASDAWLDELAKWPYPRDSWIEGIMPSLRADIPGDHPRAFVTTTPKPIELLQEWVSRKDGSVVTITGSTYDNALNLSQQVIDELQKQYEGTRIGEQELMGVLLSAATGKVFSQVDINTARISGEELPELVRIAVGVDPGGTGEEDETGVVVVGQDRHHDLYVLADHTILGVGREAARHCWNIFVQYGADKMIVENTLGKTWVTEAFSDTHKEMVADGLLPAKARPPMEAVDSKVNKKTRAQPVGMRCEQQRVHFIGHLRKLEAQCVQFDPADRDSPDRLDAFVSAARWLMKQERRRSNLVTPTSLEEERNSDQGGFSILQDLEAQLVRW